MTKKDKTIPVSIDETTIAGETIAQVIVNKQIIGQIKPDGKKFVATMNGGQRFNAKTQEGALQEILAEYNLHG